MEGPLGTLLPKLRTFHVIKHHEALPFQEIGAFMAELRAYQPANLINNISVPANLLEFLILTAVRIRQAHELRWREINWQTRTWTCPWQRTKTGRITRRDHVIPLSPEAMTILERMQSIQIADEVDIVPDGFVFLHNEPGNQEESARRLRRVGSRDLAGKLISFYATRNCLKKSMGRADLTVHGFRTTFRSWAKEHGWPFEDAEAALDHVTENDTQRRYTRNASRLEPRRKLMEAWAENCGRVEPLPAQIIPIRQAK
jgi:integrase